MVPGPSGRARNNTQQHAFVNPEQHCGGACCSFAPSEWEPDPGPPALPPPPGPRVTPELPQPQIGVRDPLMSSATTSRSDDDDEDDSSDDSGRDGQGVY